MKMIRLVCLVGLSLGLAVVYSSCERHSFADSAPGKKDGTSNLYHGHGDHGDGHEGGEEAHEGGDEAHGDKSHGDEKAKGGGSDEGGGGRKVFKE